MPSYYSLVQSVPTVGQAVFNWSLLSAVSPVAVYATRRLNPASTKFAKVKASNGANGSETDVVWDASNTANDGLATKLSATSQGSVVTWYDQSGGGFDASIPDLTTASYLLAPNIISARKQGGNSQSPVSPLLFDGVTQISPKRLVIPSGVSFSNNNCTILVVRRRLVSSQSNVEFVLGASATAIQIRTAQAAYQARTGNTSTTLTPRKYPATRWSCAAFTFSGNTLKIADENGETSYTFNMTTETFAGGVINDLAAGGTSAFQEMHAFIVIPSALSSGTTAALRTALLLTFGIETGPPDRRVIYVGDSRVEGTQATFGNTFSYQTDAVLPRVQSYNMGIYGEQLIAFTLGKYTNEVAPLYTPGSVVCLLSGFNDLTAGGATGQAVYNATVTYAQQARATGFKFVCGTTLGSFSMTAPQLTELQALNTLLRANWQTFADGFVDQEADPSLSTTSGYPTSTIWAGDRVHLQSGGQAIQASIAAPVIAALLS